jgi:urea carboxylase
MRLTSCLLAFRMVTPKYNPARTFTWEGTVGLGGAYLCIYPMSSPGGYQLMGRTLPIWNSFGAVKPFTPAKPWLLEIFDQIQFFEVSEDELMDLRTKFTAGVYELDVHEETFDFGAHATYCAGLTDQVTAWKAKQATAAKVMAAKDAEILTRLEAQGYKPGGGGGGGTEAAEVEDEFQGDAYKTVHAPFAASVWEVSASIGDAVSKGQHLCVLEAMKVETPLVAEVAGKVVAVLAAKGRMVNRGSPLVVIETQKP